MRQKFFEKRERGRDGDRTRRLARFARSFVRFVSRVLRSMAIGRVAFVVRGSWHARAAVRGVGDVRRSPRRRSRERGRGVVRRAEERKR